MEQRRRAGNDNTVAQLKDDIDSGRTGDKTATADPGLSPLGTDDEAAGRPASPERIATARSAEMKIGAIANANDAPKTHASLAWMLAVVAAAAVVIVLAFALSR